MEKSAIRSRWMLLVVSIVFAGVAAGGVLGSWAARNGYPLFTTGLLSPTLASNIAQPGQAPRDPMGQPSAPAASMHLGEQLNAVVPLVFFAPAV